MCMIHFFPTRMNLLVLMALLATSPLSAKEPKPAATQPTDNRSALHKTLEAVRKKTHVPALAAAVVHGDKVVAADAVGVRKSGSKTPVSVDDQFHIGSCSKSMTASLCAILVEQGKLGWDTTIGEVFKDLPGINDGYKEVTLEQLLSHRSGLPDDRKPDLNVFRKVRGLSGPLREQRRRMIELVLARPPATPPGEKFAYSNYGYAIAGAMCEAVTDRAYEDLMREYLFEPLGMKSAGFGPPGTKGKIDQPYGHREGTDIGGVVRVKNTGSITPVEPGPAADNPACMAPAGCIHCSISDFGRYAAWHLEGERGNARILKPETFKKLHTDKYKQQYAFGWAIKAGEPGESPRLTHKGSNTMWLAVIDIDPARDEAFVVATNVANPDADATCKSVVEQLRRAKQ